MKVLRNRNEQKSSFNLILAIDLVFLDCFRLFELLLSFLLKFFSFSFLFGSFPPFVFAHPIFTLKFLLDSILLFSEVSPNLHHLLVRFVHLDQIIRRSFILDFSPLEFIKDKLRIVFCNFIGIHLILHIFLFLRNIGRKGNFGGPADNIMQSNFDFLQLFALLDGCPLVIT